MKPTVDTPCSHCGKPIGTSEYVRAGKRIHDGSYDTYVRTWWHWSCAQANPEAFQQEGYR